MPQTPCALSLQEEHSNHSVKGLLESCQGQASIQHSTAQHSTAQHGPAQRACMGVWEKDDRASTTGARGLQGATIVSVTECSALLPARWHLQLPAPRAPRHDTAVPCPCPASPRGTPAALHLTCTAADPAITGSVPAPPRMRRRPWWCVGSAPAAAWQAAGVDCQGGMVGYWWYCWGRRRRRGHASLQWWLTSTGACDALSWSCKERQQGVGAAGQQKMRVGGGRRAQGNSM
jgi:hypothetical protein